MKTLTIEKTYSSYGNYSVRVSPVRIEFFMRKAEAQFFIDQEHRLNKIFKE